MNKTIYIIITVALVLIFAFILLKQPDESSKSNDFKPTQNVEIKDGIQYITINAKGGYSPKKTMAKADIATKLIIKTKETYDCSSALVIRSIGYQKLLPQTGEEEIDLGKPNAGTIKGLCSMGMYNFSLNFK